MPEQTMACGWDDGNREWMWSAAARTKWVSAREALKELIQDLIRKCWNATRFMESSRRVREIRKIWADKKFANFDPKTGPTIDLS